MRDFTTRKYLDNRTRKSSKLFGDQILFVMILSVSHFLVSFFLELLGAFLTGGLFQCLEGKSLSRVIFQTARRKV